MFYFGYGMSEVVRAALYSVSGYFKLFYAPVLVAACGAENTLYLVARCGVYYIRAAYIPPAAVFPVNFFALSMKTEGNERMYF